MTKKIILDLDNTLCVSVGKNWLQWLLQRYPLAESLLTADKLPYNLSKLFIIPEGDDPFAYWDYTELYDDLEPTDGAVEFVENLNYLGYEILIVSAIHTGYHAASKKRFIDKWFSYDSVIFTEDKYHIKADTFVDDSAEQVVSYKKHNPEALVVKYRQDYDQGINMLNYPNIHIEYNFEDVFNLIVGE